MLSKIAHNSLQKYSFFSTKKLNTSTVWSSWGAARQYSSAGDSEFSSRLTIFNNPSVSYFGKGAIIASMDFIRRKGFKSIMIVTDPGIVRTGLCAKVTQLLEENDLKVYTYSKCQPNPNIKNIEEGIAIWRDVEADALISIGGGSAHDNAKGIAILATNGGDIRDYEGLNKCRVPTLPLIAINTTAGTGSEITKFTIITNEEKRTKMAIVDSLIMPVLAINDPEAMLGMPPNLTAATGLDALTHAVEAYVSSESTPITDSCALKAIDLIIENLPLAFSNGQNLVARNNMCYAEYLAAMAFNNASLGYVHAIAHQLGGVYHLPHGVCNAVLLSHVQKFNAVDPKTNLRLAEIAVHLKASENTAEGAIRAIRDLADKLQIPKTLSEMGVKEEDFDLLATNAMKDICHSTNPIQYTKEEVIEIIKSAF